MIHKIKSFLTAISSECQDAFLKGVGLKTSLGIYGHNFINFQALFF